MSAVQRGKIKCIVTGDDADGAAHIYRSLLCIPPIFENEAVEMLVSLGVVLVGIPCVPTSRYERLRQLANHETDVIVLCFSLLNQDGYVRVYEKWYAEIRRLSPYTPILLVGMRRGICGDIGTVRWMGEQERSAPLTHSDGVRLCRDIGAVGYVEVPIPIRDDCIRRVSMEAVKAAMVRRKYVK